MNRIEQIKKRLDECTPGEWSWDGKVWDYDAEQEAPWLLAGPYNERVLWGELNAHEDDARLIQNAPSDLRYLLSRLESAERVVEAVRNWDGSYEASVAIEEDEDLHNALAEYDSKVMGEK